MASPPCPDDPPSRPHPHLGLARPGPLLALLAVLAQGCLRETRPVELPLQAVTSAGGDAVAQMSVPPSWTPLVPSATRAEFLAPDRHTRSYFRAMPGERDPRKCAALTKQYAAEVVDAWGGPPRTRVAARTAGPDGVSFELRRSEPKPSGEVTWSRVLCREGVLTIASCTTPTPSEAEQRPVCQQMLQSLEVVPRPHSR